MFVVARWFEFSQRLERPNRIIYLERIMMRHLTWLLLVAGFCASGEDAYAKKIKMRPEGPMSLRPIHVTPGDIQVYMGPYAAPKFGTFNEAGLTMFKLPDFGDEKTDDFWFFQTGIGYGVTKGLEVGALMPSSQISPEARSGDLPIYGRYVSDNDSTAVGIQLGVTIPLRSEEDAGFWKVNPGLHVDSRWDGGRVELGVFIPTTFMKQGDESYTRIEGNFPLRVLFDVGKRGFLALDTGYRNLDFDQDYLSFIPLGFGGGYTVKAGDVLLDFTGSLMWQTFLWAGAPDEVDDQIIEDSYTISFGVNARFELGGGK